ncbi:gigasin-6-like [Crassostrea virginica]|uniref:Gigasin-6-like isoform X2 n=1 Tax=Crassostrea virginica TaxID=6565 RepID=A0A8B8E5M7_CRAVI|nr:gigasin-6-like isoform X2 [Crassostrea virginica]
MSSRTLLSSLFVSCLVLLTCYGQVEDQIRATLTSVYANCRNQKNPGLIVSVVKDGQAVLTEAYGVKDKISSEPVTTDTLFGLGGLSALFANMLIAKKNQDYAEMDEDTTLRNLFGNNKLFDKSKLRSRYATSLDIMAHRLGFKNTPYLLLDDTVSRGGSILERIAPMKPRGRFRDSFYYNEILYGILTTIGERLGRNGWEELVKDEIYTPLGMTKSGFLTTVTPANVNIAKAYTNDEGSLYPVSFEFLKKWSRLCSTTCIISSANDMAKFMNYLLSNGTIPGTNTELLNRKVHRDLFDAYNRLQDPSIEDYFLSIRGVPVSRTHFAYAMGIKRGMYNNERILETADDMHGYNTLMTLFPDHKLGIFIAMTGEDKKDLFRTALSSYISDLYLGKEPWLNSSLLCSFPEPFMKGPDPDTPRTHPEVPLGRAPEDFIGKYTNDIYGTAEIVSERGILVFKYGFGTFDLKREESTSLKFNMFPTGLIHHMFSVDDLRFRQKTNSTNIEAFTVDKFDDAKFVRVVPQTTASPTATEKPVGGIAIPV